MKDLPKRYGDERNQLLQLKKDRQAESGGGLLPHYLTETKHIRV
ncbi:hypothetical protein [Salipaludibacillus keqinensis]|nr:hypothetical protein [Salipaludibacillus keqinensis]